MRPITFILIGVLTIGSCTSNTQKKIKPNYKFDTLLSPKDSTAFYFKSKPHWQDTTNNALDTFANSWFSQMLFALKEPILKDYKGDKEIYRFTWLRTFNHPVVIRLEKQRNIIVLFSKVSDGAGGYEPGKIIFDTTINLTQKQVDTINLKLDNAEFWAFPSVSLDDTGSDGSEWIIEVFKNNKYHMAVRWTPVKGTAFRAIGEYLISISKIKGEIGVIDRRSDGDY